MSDESKPFLEPVDLSGGKRTHIAHSEWMDDWWVGYGKDEGCQFEGPWHHMANLAARILSHPNTAEVAPLLYIPGLDDNIEQEFTYAEYRMGTTKASADLADMKE